MPLRRKLALGLVLATLAFASRSGAEAAFFEIDVPPHPETFVVKLRDPERIEHARRVLAGEETAVQVMGKVGRRAKPWNVPWSFRLTPRSVEFFEVAIEVCDANIAYVEEHLDEVGGAFLPGRVWCPWGSRILREIPRP